MQRNMELTERAAQAKPVNPIPDHLRCFCCFGPVINGYHTDQGVRLCKTCVFTKLHPTIPFPCVENIGDSLQSSENLEVVMVSQEKCIPDLGSRREMSRLHVRCINVQCSAELLWKDVEIHLKKECDFEMSCCSLCSKNFVLYKLHSEHTNLESENCCQNYRGPCPKCQDQRLLLSRAEFIDHSDTCPAIKTLCIFHCVGCKEVMQRSELSDHCNSCTNKHLEQTVRRVCAEVDKRDKRFSEIGDVVAAMQERIIKLETENEELAVMKDRISKLETQNKELHAIVEKMQSIIS